MKINFPLILVSLALLFYISSCGSRFMQASTTQEQYQAREKGCSLVYLSKAPTDKKYVVLGECTGKAMNGIVRTNYESAFKRVEDCACKNGGNALILLDGYSEGFQSRDDYGMPQYTQTNVAVTAVIIFIED